MVVREVQRHPATERVTHIDFLRIREDREIQVAVPIRIENEDQCVGVKLSGGTVTRSLIEVEVSCLPRDLPESIVVDISELDIGNSIHLSELPLPDGVTIPSLDLGDDRSRDLPVVSVSLVRVAIEEEAVEDEVVEGLVEEGDAVESESTGDEGTSDD